MAPWTTLEIKKTRQRSLQQLDRFALLQRITGLYVEPGFGAVTFRFRTTRATVPLVEVYEDMADTPYDEVVSRPPAATRFPLFGGLQLAHDIPIDGLTQGQAYVFRIMAGSGDPTIAPALVIGSLITAHRRIHLVVQEIRVFRDGDPSSQGDMVFRGALYDADAERKLAGDFRYPAKGEAGISDGRSVDYPFGFPVASLESAPERVTLFIGGWDSDVSDVPYPDGLEITGELLPQDEIPLQGHGEDDDRVWATVGRSFTLGSQPGVFTIPFVLQSGNWGISYSVTGYIGGKITPGAATTSVFDPLAGTKMMMVREIGAPQVIGKRQGLHAGFALAPDGAAYLDGRRIGGRVAGPLTVLRTEDGLTQLYARTRDRTVAHATLRAADEIPEWTDLGGRIAGDVTAVDHGGTVAIFATDDGGSVQQLGRDGRWIDLGGHVRGPIAALASGHDIHLCALGVDGRPQHRRASGGDWQSLGREFAGPVVLVGGEDRNVTAVAFDLDRSAWAKNLNGDVWEDEWTALGTIDDVEPKRVMVPDLRDEVLAERAPER